MPKLTVRHILVCEDFRQEARGLASLLGYYGALPHVELVVANFALGNRLTLVISFAPVDGNFNLVVRLLDPKGAPVVAGEMKVPLKATLQKSPNAPVRPVTNANVAMSFLNLILPMPGVYRVEILADGEKVHDSTFNARQADPEELA